MRSDFSVACKDARERIAVPAFPLAAIRERARAAAVPPRNRRRWLVTALLAGASVAGAAATADVWTGAHVSQTKSGAVILTVPAGDHAQFKKRPTAEQVRALVRTADFPVVLPTGLPEGSRLIGAGNAGTSALVFAYDLPGAWRRSDHALQIVLANPLALAAPPKNVRSKYYFELGGDSTHAGARWTIGGEDVFLTRSSLTPAELAHFKSAMTAQARRSGAMR